MSRGCSSLVIAKQCFHSKSTNGTAIAIQQFSAGRSLPKIQTCPKAIVKDIDATDSVPGTTKLAPVELLMFNLAHLCSIAHHPSQDSGQSTRSSPNQLSSSLPTVTILPKMISAVQYCFLHILTCCFLYVLTWSQ